MASKKSCELKEFNSKSLLANVYDTRINNFILNDDFGVINSDENWELRKEKQFPNNKNKTLIKIDEDSAKVLNRHRSSIMSPNANKINNDLIRDEINLLLNEIRKITKKIQDDEEDGEKALDWKFAGMVIDKFCLYMFSIITLILTLVILLSAPNFFKFK